jgi:hypothetical protein
MHPYLAQQLAKERRDRFLREAEQSRLARSAVRNPIARLRFRSLTQRIGVFGATLLAENTGAIALIRATSWPFAWTYDGPELTLTMAIDREAGS